MAAAESFHQKQGYSPQEIHQEVRNFLQGVTYRGPGPGRGEALTQSALVLLQTLPTARHAVLEYLAGLFDEAINNCLMEMDIGHNVPDGGGPVVESVLHDACGVLHGFIQSTSGPWAPIISAWSLELLGHISGKYSDRRGMPHTGSLNELLQLWMTCKPTKLLIEVATECFAQMVGGAPESCVDTLLEASVKYSPHFDWVVAHIGSCFPTTIITRVLMCGLKDYCQHGGRGGGGDIEAKVPKMGSVVGILGHLASRHGQDIRNALMNLFQESLCDESQRGRITTIPFLLQLASMSPMLLHILATDMVAALTAPVLNKLHKQFSTWKTDYPQEFDSLMTLVIHLLMQTDLGADKALDFLLYNATITPDTVEPGTLVPAPEIRTTCASLIEKILKETQMFVLRRAHFDGGDIPFLGALSSRLPQLTADLLHSDNQRGTWLQKLICYIILYKGERHGAETLAYILCRAENPTQLSRFVHIQHNIEVGMAGVLATAVQMAVDELQPHRDTDKQRLLDNICHLVQWEASAPDTILRSTLKLCLQSHSDALASMLFYADLSIAMVTLKIVNCISLPTSLSSSVALKVCSGVVALFLRLMDIEDHKQSNKLVHACKSCAKTLTTTVYAQSVLVRYLIEAAMEKENRHLFGGKVSLETSKSGTRDSHTSLLAENKSHGLSLTLLRSHSSVFHAGVIGQGLRRDRKSSVLHKNRLAEAILMSTNNIRFHEELKRIAENKSHGLSLTLLRSHSSVFHAGVIGQGLRRDRKSSVLHKDMLRRNRNYLLELLWVCSQESKASNTSVEIKTETDLPKPPANPPMDTDIPKPPPPTHLDTDLNSHPNPYMDTDLRKPHANPHMDTDMRQPHVNPHMDVDLRKPPVNILMDTDLRKPPVSSVPMDTDLRQPPSNVMDTDLRKPLINPSLKVSADMCRMISSLLVELTTPDVLYNNRFWPEEDSIKMTIERDLLVWKSFDDNPVLWEILEMFASNTLIMSRCSPVIKSLTAFLMLHFESAREKSAANSPKQLECVCHVIRCLGKSGLLPSPLGILSELFPLVSPYEAHLLLLTVWRYMKENPPTEDPDEVLRRECDRRHVDVVRSIVHKNIGKAGFLYLRLFQPVHLTVIKTEGS